MRRRTWIIVAVVVAVVAIGGAVAVPDGEALGIDASA